MNSRKVLIISVTAGYGHHATALAMEKALRARGADVTVVDIIRYVSEVLYRTVDKGYVMTTKFTPKQFGTLYRSMLSGGSMHRTLGYIIKSGFFTDKIVSLLRAETPDVVLSTHVLASVLIDKSLAGGFPRLRHIGIMTDYTLHPYWEEVQNLHNLVLCGEMVIPRAERRGLPREKLLPLGIPVEDRFLTSVPMREARVSLGLPPERPAVLIMSGSMGFGNVGATVSRIASLRSAPQILCVCGGNKRLKLELETMRHSTPVTVYGFADNVDVLMDAADMVVTKPGGLSTTEALVKQKPLILTAPI
ncbi:MAG: galactosyldiacylglycerol synthase, partial [Oscillospiraceae bacterium]|nr:galactosyldiacylglycerol synthase [Oscillospiraceae bacterium]